MTIQKEEEKQHILIFQFDNNGRIFLFLYGFECLEHSIPIDSLVFYHTKMVDSGGEIHSYSLPEAQGIILN